MIFDTLDRFFQLGIVYDVTYQDICLWKMYVEFSQPSLDEFMMIKKYQWENLDKKDTVKKYNAFTASVSTPKLNTTTNIPPVIVSLPRKSHQTSNKHQNDIVLLVNFIRLTLFQLEDKASILTFYQEIYAQGLQYNVLICSGYDVDKKCCTS